MDDLKIKSETWIDKSSWGDGPWQDEPDRVEFIDPTTGLTCLLLRANPRLGHWCGYVAVPPGHRLHSVDYDEAPEATHYAAHRGLTFSGPCRDRDDRPKREQVCHVPAPGELDDVWWFGFDCGHGGTDYIPGLVATRPPLLDALERWPAGEAYRDVAYVTGRCRALAKALAT